MKAKAVRIFLTIGLLASAVAAMFSYQPLKASAATLDATSGQHHIVFQTSSGGPIYVMNPDGSGLRYLTDGIDPAISPDGQQVAFTRWQGAVGSVWVINIDGTGERQLIGNIAQPKSPSWSADGTQLVFNLQHGGTTMPTQTCFSSRRRVPGAPARYFCFSKPSDPNWRLATIDVATGHYQDQYSDAKSFGPSWDPADPNLVVAQGQRGLALSNLKQQTYTQLTNDPLDKAPVYSPDGSKIAESYWQSGHWDIHVMNADGSGAVRVTQTPDTWLVDQQLAGNKNPQPWNNAAPAWSPDGSQIAFVSDRTGSWQIWIMNADGSNQHLVFPNGLPNGLTIDYFGMSERVLSWR
jgi:TolB protein